MSWRIVARASLVAVLVGAAGVGTYAGTRHARDQPVARATSSAPPPATAFQLATTPPTSAPTSAPPMPSAARLAAVLHAPLAASQLGGRVLVEVRDASTAAVLFRRGAAIPAAPASTAKLATAVAVLAVHAASDRITTRVVAGTQPGTIVLVGGGDPTLTGAAANRPGAYPDAGRITDLARQLRGVPVRRIAVDGSLFTGPGVSPDWAPEDVPSDYAAPITAAMVDGGRETPSATTRSITPDLAAGRALAAALGLRGVQVSRARAPAGARTLATVESAPIGTLVEQMLLPSDNVIAECLARQVALAEHRPASFAGATAAVRETLRDLGVEIGAGMVDGSGLAAGDRLTPDALIRVLALVTARHPDLRGILDALPVAAWSGTLATRYTAGSAKAGAGVVRAKTGTLTSVSTLAGVAQDVDGRLLIFAAMADRVGPSVADTSAAEAALDRVAATLARCGCR
jgi:D-alanyl-D-alanine carboxypeptidase/D-alanyl-D-alanine-endopeptidase (penicillin-binding protein 4)